MNQRYSGRKKIETVSEGVTCALKIISSRDISSFELKKNSLIKGPTSRQ